MLKNTLSSCDYPYPIVIIDTSSYQIVTVIHLKEYIIDHSSLCVFDEHSFISVYEGTLLLQISNEDGSILFHSNTGKFNGWYRILPLEGGKCFAVDNDKRISIMKLCYA